MALDLRDRSLGALIELNFGLLPDHLAGSASSLSPHTRALANWYRLVLVLAAKEFPNTNHKPDLRSAGKLLWERMTTWHRQSFRLLYEWWTAIYQEPAISLAGILELVGRSSMLDHGSEMLDSDAWRYVLRVLELKRWPSGDVKGPSEGASMQYNERLISLFNWEFGTAEDPSMDDSMNGESRRTARSQAAQYAYCQRVSWELLHHGQRQESTSTLEDADGSDGREIKQKPGHTKTNALEQLWNDQSPFASMTAKGPIIEACPWIKKNDMDTEDLPFYLWDAVKMKTVKSSSLDMSSYPTYTAISHTWGRWVTAQPIDVDGVPWKVPQNKKFPVRDLPTLLQSVPGGSPYIWLDLVCIPQNGSLRGAKEISRQARIFNAARYVIAWQNEVESFDGLQSILEWKSLHLLTLTDENENRRIAGIERAWSNMAGKQSGLLQPRSGKLEWANMALNPWYTSLWTLQEVSLRPDLWLCSKDWEFLSLDGTTPLPFSGFVAIDEIFWQQNPDKRQYPLHPEAELQSHVCLFELGYWRFETGLSKILGLDRVSLFTLGDRRECKERRGEAIMAALGVTAWYDNAVRKTEQEGGSAEELFAQTERDLVLKKYPFNLVEELSAKVPGDFFASFIRVNFDAKGGDILFPSPGSMLPFSDTKSYYQPAGGFRINNFQIPARTHESVRKWRITPTGQVRICEAFIIYSNVAPNVVLRDCIIPVWMGICGSNLVAKHEAPLPENFKSIHGDTGMDFTDNSWANFEAWISTQQEETYAIVVQYQRSRLWMACSGLIIKRHTEGFLFKSDVFFLVDEKFAIDISASEETDMLIN